MFISLPLRQRPRVPIGWDQASPGRTRTLAGPGPAVRRGRVSRSPVCETVRQANGLRDVDWTFGKFILFLEQLIIESASSTPYSTPQKGCGLMELEIVNRACPVLYIVVPCYNEEDVLPETAKRLREKVRGLISAGEIDEKSRILFVNDGSRD